MWCGGWWEEGRCQSARLWWREVKGVGRLTEATKKKKQRDKQTSNNNRTFRPKLQNEALLLQNSASETGLFDFSEIRDTEQTHTTLPQQTRRAILPTDNNRQTHFGQNCQTKIFCCKTRLPKRECLVSQR